jgi:hypothetical protein
LFSKNTLTPKMDHYDRAFLLFPSRIVQKEAKD